MHKIIQLVEAYEVNQLNFHKPNIQTFSHKFWTINWRINISLTQPRRPIYQFMNSNNSEDRTVLLKLDHANA
jgi:hypothetical protein